MIDRLRCLKDDGQVGPVGEVEERNWKTEVDE